MSEGAAAVGGPATGGIASFRTRLRLRHPVIIQIVRYALVGGLGTGANALIFIVLRTWWDTLPANLVAIVLSTIVSTEANRRFTFGGVSVLHPWREYVQNGGTVLFYAFYSSVVLLLLDTVVDDPSPLVQSISVAAASVLGGCARFLVLRLWVFDPDDVDDHIAHPAD